MVGQHKLLINVKQLALFGAVLGLVFGTGAVSFGGAFASGNDKIDICYKGKDKEVKEKDLEKWLGKGATEGECDDDDDKINICHKGKDKKIKEKSLKSHLKHGDTLGKCKHHDDDDDDDDDDDKKFKKGKVLTGDGPPPDKLGKKGDLYFDSRDDDSLEYYVKVGKKEWELRGTLVEPSNDCERGDVLKFNKVDNKWVCVEDLVEDDDADPENELQDLSLSGQDLSLTPAGNTANLPFVFDDFDCPTDEVVVGFNDDGTTKCAPGGGGGTGDITAVNTASGSGLLGGADEGDVDLAVDDTIVAFLGSLVNIFSGDMQVDGTFDVIGDVSVGGLLEPADLFFETFDSTNCLDTDGCLPGGYLLDSSVDKARIVPDSLDAGQIATDAITADELANDAVDTSSIQDESVTTAKLDPDAVKLKVTRQSSGLQNVEAEDEAEVDIDCVTGFITGFTLLSPDESADIFFGSMVDDGSDPATATIQVFNVGDIDRNVEVIFYCAELEALGVP